VFLYGVMIVTQPMQHLFLYGQSVGAYVKKEDTV